jgi:hypothetical protein
MSLLTLNPRAKADGSLTLELPPGSVPPGAEVRVTVDAIPKPMTQAEWAAWVYSVCGTVDDDTFVRPPQGELEEREPLS